MKRIFTLLVGLLIISNTNGQSLYDQLSSFNFNWDKYQNQIPQTDWQADLSEAQWVQMHLGLVIPILKENTLKYNIQQREKREFLIGRLEEYSKAACFPINQQKIGRAPVFIDENQTHCAVAFLLKETGNGDLAKEISQEFNLEWIKDIRNEDLLQWQEGSGFTLEELKLIQGAYDNYTFNGRMRADRFDIPQEPKVGVDYYAFDNLHRMEIDTADLPLFWMKGEGENGILDGKWIQNAGNGNLWIEGYFSHGNRTGQWKEFYKGTKILCRTENWRDHKLNGLRKRFNREGQLIEVIEFVNGNAISKINFDLEKGLQFIRKPLGENLMETEIFNQNGRLVAKGKEEIHNPGNLQWFQDIELTALNQFALNARESSVLEFNIYSSQHHSSPKASYQNQVLVEYKRQGNWVFYRESWDKAEENQKINKIIKDYPHFATEISKTFSRINSKINKDQFDSITINFVNNNAVEFIGKGLEKKFHLHFAYHLNDDNPREMASPNLIKTILTGDRISNGTIAEQGEYNEQDEKSGVWYYFNSNGQCYRMENYEVENHNKRFFGQPEIVSGGF